MQFSTEGQNVDSQLERSFDMSDRLGIVPVIQSNTNLGVAVKVLYGCD